MVSEKVKGLIAEQLKLDLSKVTDEAKLVEDLGADSANIMVLIMDLEDTYNMTVEDNVITSLKTVADVIAYIEKRLKEQ